MLTAPAFIVRNLMYHWRGNLAVLLGVAVGSAVLTGALLVGDSLRGSLRERAERQLGGIDAAAQFHKPNRAPIANALPGTTAPVLMLNGSVQAGVLESDTAAFVGRVNVIGIDDHFKLDDGSGVNWNAKRSIKGSPPIVLSRRVAERLGVNAGDTVRLGVPRFSDLPRSSSLAKRGVADATASEAFMVAGILPEESRGNDFNLTPTPAAPLNVFVPIAVLSNLVRDETDRSDAPLANALLASGASVNDLNAALRQQLRAEDYGLRLRSPSRHERYLSVESEQLVLSPVTVDAVEKAAADLKLRAEPTIVYVADSLAFGKREIPYPVIAGLNLAARPPLGPFLPPGVSELRDGEVVLLDWVENPLGGLAAGTKLKLTYFNPDVEGDGKKEAAELALRGYIPMTGPAKDRDLTPVIRGVTDERAKMFDWDRPPMLPREEIQKRVPDNSPRARFWNAERATPMAYVNLATAKKFFTSRFGAVTSIRVVPSAGQSLDETAERLAPAIVAHLDPASAGLVFEPIRERLLTASHGGTDFGGLFLGFSCFLIAAALMLVGLLFRLSLDRRAKEIGLLLATGYSVKQVRGLLLGEGLAIAVLGAVIGLAAAIAYNELLLKVLTALWPDREVGTFLKPHETATSFAIGYSATGIMALVAVWLGIRGLVRVSPPALLRGETTTWRAGAPKRGRIAKWLVMAFIPFGIALIASGSFLPNPDFQAMSFFGGGALLLTAALAALWLWMKRTRHKEVNGRGWPALVQLGTRNAARNPTRSLLTAALLASAAFLLVAVESFRREPGRDFLEKSGGSGGFNLIAEADAPLYQLADTPLASIPPQTDGTPNVFALRLRTGDDASCLNLFQATRPRILGVPEALIRRGGFQFYETEARTTEEKANPWRLLQTADPDAAVPVFCENNTAMWMLKTGVGGIIKVPDDSGAEIALRIVGTFSDSPFQSELVMADANFVRLFPKQDGYRVFLIRVPPAERAETARKLEVGLRRNGLIVTPTRQRVAEYQAVIGAYLSTFQLLGGFGLLLGVFGLAVVVLRNVWERLGELALLRAMGYRTRALQFLVLAENALLLGAGLAAGVLTALASVAPHVAEGAAVPWARLAVLLGLAVAAGLSVASAAAAGILRVPLIPALRRE
ncbi:MAG TPA: FtsX-like permease family protein [Urbifossiella sp.]|nr:FtsX-like permease family protein [Urbifossiella sp.]